MTACISSFLALILSTFIWYTCWSLLNIWRFLQCPRVQCLFWAFWVFSCQRRIQRQSGLTVIKKQNLLHICCVLICHPVAYYQNTWNKYVSVYRGCCVLKYSICVKLFWMKIGTEKVGFRWIWWSYKTFNLYYAYSQEPP